MMYLSCIRTYSTRNSYLT